MNINHKYWFPFSKRFYMVVMPMFVSLMYPNYYQYSLSTTLLTKAKFVIKGNDFVKVGCVCGSWVVVRSDDDYYTCSLIKKS